MPGRIGWHLSQWIYSQFDRSNLTGHEILLKLGVNPEMTPNSIREAYNVISVNFNPI